jgi:hypothetical protein
MKIAFYTCFFGEDSNERNKIPPCPSKTHDCFFYTNNSNTYARLENTEWNAVFVNIPVKNNLTADAMDAKHLKACPYMYPELNAYDATCYFDSALTVNTYDVIELAEKTFTYSNYEVIIARHPFISATWPPSARSEFKNAMLQPRYEVEREKYEKYMAEQIQSGLLEEDDIHYATGFIVRKNNMEMRKMGEVWYRHILACGIECQISFFFVQQMFKGKIYGIEPYSCFSRLS